MAPELFQPSLSLITIPDAISINLSRSYVISVDLPRNLDLSPSLGRLADRIVRSNGTLFLRCVLLFPQFVQRPAGSSAALCLANCRTINCPIPSADMCRSPSLSHLQDRVMGGCAVHGCALGECVGGLCEFVVRMCCANVLLFECIMGMCCCVNVLNECCA